MPRQFNEGKEQSLQQILLELNIFLQKNEIEPMHKKELKMDHRRKCKS